MSLENYKRVWKAQSEQPGSFRTELEAFVARLDRSYRRERAVLAVCSLNTCIATLLVISMVFQEPVLNWAELWPAAGVQMAGIVALTILVRRHSRRRRAREWSGAPMIEAARHALADVEGEVRNLKLLLGAGLFMMPLLAIAGAELYSSGKMNEKALASFGILCVGVLATNALVMTAKYRRKLRPERRRLTEIVAAFEQGAQPS